MTDPSLAKGTRDAQTVTKAGVPTAQRIDGVKTRSMPVHVDHRGTVFEIFEDDLEFWETPLVYAYQFSIRPGMMKGWGLHEFKRDRYTIIDGEVLVLLYDARPDSPTHGVVQKVYLSDRAERQVIIPQFVWHLNVNLLDTEARLLNFPTEVYHHEAPDRLLLPWDTDEIPVDVAALLAVF